MSEIKETLTTGTFDLLHYSDNVNEQSLYIKNKIKVHENKINNLKLKETIMSNIIKRLSDNIDKALYENNFKLVEINQHKLPKFFESLSIIQDMTIKYEDMIQKYIKMILDIENNKVSVYAKIKTADKSIEKNDNDYKDLMEAIHRIENDAPEESNPMMEHVRKELKLEGY